MKSVAEQRQEQRLTYIDLCVYVLGQVNRNQLMRRFDIKEAAASRDFTEYKKHSLDAVLYDGAARCYRPQGWFTPLFEHKASDALSLVYRGEQTIACEGELANRVAGYIPRTELKLSQFAETLKALNLQKKAAITYLSRTSGETERIIAPHSLFESNRFYYVRAYDHLSGEFRNFKLNRIISSTFKDNKALDSQISKADRTWNKIIKVTIGINGFQSHPETIAYDFGLKNGRKTIEIREAMLPFLLESWSIAAPEYGDLPLELFPLRLIEIQ